MPSWSVISYAADDITVYQENNNRKVWITGTFAQANGNAVFEGTYDGSTITWAARGTGIVRISAVSGGIYGVGQDQRIFRWINNSWTEVDQNKALRAFDIAVTTATTFYYVGNDSKIWKYDGSNNNVFAEATGMQPVRLAVGNAVWIVCANGHVFSKPLNGGGWAYESEISALDVAASGSKAWVVGKVPRRADGGVVCEKTTDGWVTRGKMGIALACAGEADVWVVNAHGAILRYF